MIASGYKFEEAAGNYGWTNSRHLFFKVWNAQAGILGWLTECCNRNSGINWKEDDKKRGEARQE
jgi:hypothetical protein